MGFFSDVGHAVSSVGHTVTHPGQFFSHPGAAAAGAFAQAMNIAQAGNPLGMAASAFGGAPGGLPIPGLGDMPPNFAQILGGAVGALKNIAGGQAQLRKDLDTAVVLNQRTSKQIAATSKIVGLEAKVIARDSKLISGSFQLIGKTMADTNRLRKTIALSNASIARGQHENILVLEDIDRKMQAQIWLIAGGLMMGALFFAIRKRPL